METSGQPKYDSTSMGGGKMKQLKITKRQAALMLLELCHGFFDLICHLCVCSGNIRAWKRTVCTGGMSAVSAKCRPVSGREESNSFLAVRNRYVASDRRVCDACREVGVCGIWTGISGEVVAAFSYFYGRASKKTCWLKIPSYPWLGIALVLYFLGQHFVSDTAIRIAPVLAALYYLLCNFHINLKEVDSFLKNTCISGKTSGTAAG